MRTKRATFDGRHLVFFLAAAILPLQACESPLGTTPTPRGDAPLQEGVSGPADFEPPPGATRLADADLETLFASSISGLTSPQRLLVESESAWGDVWSRLTATTTNPDPAPEVDFSTHSVLVLGMGSRPTGGYSIAIEAPYVTDDALYVPVEQRHPAPACFTTQAVTRPAVAVSLPRQSGKELIFIDVTTTHDCG